MKYTKIHILFGYFGLGKYPTGVRFPRQPWQNDCIRHVSQPQWKIRTKNGHDSQQLLIQLKSNRHLISSTSLFCTDLHNQWSDCNRNWCGFSLSSYLMSLQKEFLVLDKSSWSWCKVARILVTGIWCSTQMNLLDHGLNSWSSSPRSPSTTYFQGFHHWSILDWIRDQWSEFSPSMWRAGQWSVQVGTHFIHSLRTQRL